jgi:hypothetical protein
LTGSAKCAFSCLVKIPSRDRDALKAKKIVEKIKQIHLQVQETLKKSQEKYKARHDQHKIERTFRVGDRQ